jgi:hypothetical protein
MSDKFYVNDAPVGHLTADGVDTDDDSLSFEDGELVELDDTPWNSAFATDEFRRFTVVTARPIDQQYRIDGETYTFRKPPEALASSLWSIDNAPTPLGHPDSGLVQSLDEVHGFVTNPRYDAERDRQLVDAYVPTTDEAAREWIDDHRGVSLGFFNTLDWDADGVDAYQRDLRVDHVAFVEHGRCSVEDGCAIYADDATVPELTAADRVSVRTIGDDLDNEHGGDDDCSAGPCSCGEHVTDAPSPLQVETAFAREKGIGVSEDYDIFGDATVYGVKEDEATDGPKYPMETCSDVDDAWKLRGHGDYEIAQSTLEERIKDRADSLDCDESSMPWTDTDSEDEHSPPNDTDVDAATDADTTTTDSNLDTMSDDDTPTDDPDNEPDVTTVTVDEFTVSTDAAHADEVEETLTDAAERIETLGADKADLQSTVEDLQSDLDEVQAALDEYRTDEFREKAERLADLSTKVDSADALVERFEDDEDEMDVEWLDTRLDWVEEAAATSGDAIGDESAVSTDSSPSNGSAPVFRPETADTRRSSGDD